MTDIVYTNQRIEIIEFLKNNKSHPTVEQVYQGVKKKLSRISRATVYQNLRLLAEKGLIQEVNIKGVTRYEPNTRAHHHFICKNCGQVMDFEMDELTDYAMKVSERLRGAQIESSSTNFYGICSKCGGK